MQLKTLSIVSLVIRQYIRMHNCLICKRNKPLQINIDQIQQYLQTISLDEDILKLDTLVDVVVEYVYVLL